MIDKENNVDIEVICLNGNVDKIFINGIEEYFIYMDSQISLEQYEEIKETKVNVSSTELMLIIDRNWDSSIDFGTRDSIFKNYHIYFDKGIEVRKISGKIYNIVFNKNYKAEVLPEITVGTDFDFIQRKLGKASFEDKDLGIIGYKCEKFYIFFSKDEISVYRRNISETENFLKILDEFFEDKINLNELLNELTYLWPDYSEYKQGQDYFFISYPMQGLDIKYNYNNTSGIIFYNNFNATQRTIEEYLQHTEIIARLKLDNVFEVEKRRKEEKDNLIQDSIIFKDEFEKQENAGESNRFAYYIDFDDLGYVITVYFISKDNNSVNSELNESIDTYTWAEDNYFIYSVKNKGIYFYNVAERTKGTITSGVEDYQIKGFSNGILKYDNKEIRIDFH